MNTLYIRDTHGNIIDTYEAKTAIEHWVELCAELCALNEDRSKDNTLAIMVCQERLCAVYRLVNDGHFTVWEPSFWVYDQEAQERLKAEFGAYRVEGNSFKTRNS